MSDLSSVLSKARATIQPQAPVEAPSDMQQNLRSGALRFRADLNQLGGRIAEVAGADPTSLYNEAAAGAAESQAILPERIKTTSASVNDIGDAWNQGQTLRHLGDIARNAPANLVQGAASMAVPVAAGLVGGAVGGVPGAIAAGTLAGAPQIAGDITGRQREAGDNGMTPGQNLARAVGGGLASSAVQNAIPGAMEAKFLGQVAGKTLSSMAPKSLASSVAQNLTLGVGVQGVAGGAGEAVNMASAGQELAPGAIAEAGIQNAVMGAPFAGMGVAGDRIAAGRHAGAVGRAGAAPGGVELPAGVEVPGTMRGGAEAPKPGGGGFTLPENFEQSPAARRAAREKAQEQAKSGAGDAQTAPEGRDTINDLDMAAAAKSVAEKIRDGEPVVDDLGAFAGATGRAAMDMFDKGKKTAGEWVRKAAAAYVDRQNDLTPAEWDVVQEANANPDDPATQKKYADFHTAREQRDKDMVLLEDLRKEFPEDAKAPGSKQSASTAAVDQRVAGLLQPYMADKHPDVQKAATGVLRHFVTKAGEGDFSEQAARRIGELLGDNATEALTRVYDAVAPKDAVKDARFARNLQRAQEAQSRDMNVKKAIVNALPKDSTINPEKLADTLMAWARGDSKGGPDMRGAMYHAAMRQRIEDTFGSEAGSVLEALENYTNREAKPPGSTGGRIDTTIKDESGESTGRVQKGAKEGTVDENGQPVNDEGFDPIYYGAGSDPLTSDILMPSPEAHKAQYDTPSRVEQLIKVLKKDNPDRNVRFITERELNRENGVEGGALDRGKVVIEERADPDQFSERDLKAVQLDTKKYGRSPSRINVTDEIPAEKNSLGQTISAREPGVTVDATKLTARYLRNQESGTGDTNLIRNGKAFLDGIVALKSKYPEFDLDGLSDSTVIDRNGNTYGDFKKAMRTVDTAEDRMSANDKAKLAAARKQWKNAGPEDRALLEADVREIIANSKDEELSKDLNEPGFAAALFDIEGNAKAAQVINANGPVHGGIDTGKVQSRDRDTALARNEARVVSGRMTESQRATEEQARQLRNADRKPSDARTANLDRDGNPDFGTGRRELPLDENIHAAARVAGDNSDPSVDRSGRMAKQVGETIPRDLNMDANPQPRGDDKPALGKEEGKAMMIYANKMRQSEGAAGRKIGDRLMTLIANANVMAARDVSRLRRVAEQKLEASAAATVVNDLGRKYKDVIVSVKDPRAALEQAVLYARKGDSAGEDGKPVNTRPIPPDPEMTKSGKKALESSGKGTPTKTLYEPLGTQRDDLINPVERINSKLQGKKEGTNRPKAQAAKKAALVEAASSSDPALLHELRTTDDAHGLQRTTDFLNATYDKYLAGNKFYETLKSGDPEEMLRTTRETIDRIKRSGDTSLDALQTITELENTGESMARAMRKTDANKAVNDLLEHGPQSFSKLVDAMVGHLNTADAALAQVLQQIVGEVKVVKRQIDPNVESYFGAHNNAEGIHITQLGENLSATTLLHEAVHAATVKAIASDDKLHAAIQFLMEDTEKVDPTLKHEYGYLNAKEFLAEAMTNSALQEKLRALKPSQQADEVMKGRSFWSDLVDYLAEWMGLNKEQRTALDQAMRLTSEAMKVQVEEHGGVSDSAKFKASIETGNERMSELVQNPDTQYSMLLSSHQSAGAATNATVVNAATRKAIRDHIEKVLGPDVLVAFKRMAHEGDFTPMAQTPRGIHDLIRISVHSLDPMGTAFHESMHGFVNNMRKAGMHDVVNTLQKVADSRAVREQMERILGHDSAVMKQLRGADPEERIAYMYQLYAANQLDLPTAPRGILDHIRAAINSVLGIWSNDQRALHIMEYFNSGEYAKEMGNRDAVMAHAQNAGKNATIEKVKTLTEPFVRLSDTVLAAGSARVRDTDNPHLNRIADLIKPQVGDTKGGDIGFVMASRLAKTKFMNDVGAKLHGLSEQHLKEAIDSLQTGQPAASPEARIAARDVQKFLRGMHNYMTKAGVAIQDLGPDYFPRVWDAVEISKNQGAFINMMTKYVARGDITAAGAHEFMQKVMHNNGNEFDVDVRRPGMQHAKERVLSFIEPQDAAAFQQKDLFRTLNDYVLQATRRAEWQRRFSGEDSIENLLDNARKGGATDSDIAMTERYLQGVTGTLGDSLNPTLRRLQGNIMVYQNIRLLPLAIFSSIVDPMGLMVRGATLGEAFTAFKYGVSQIANNLRRTPTNDAHADLAQLMGTIDDAVLTATLGESYQQGMVGATGRKINDAFFKYNLMEGWNRSMRIAATHSAVEFINRNATGTETRHSARWLDELGLKPADIQRKPDGTLKLTEADGLTKRQAFDMQVAINKWVDGAILRPDSADKPIWHNDARFALVAHLKQFVYSFQHTIIDRVTHEASEGNYAPAMALASYVPVMIAADALKGLLTTGGEPQRKEKWGVGEYIYDGVQRAGLLGVGQFRHDIVEDALSGRSLAPGLGAIDGPTLDQLGEAVQVAQGRRSMESFTLNNMPANKLWNSH